MCANPESTRTIDNVHVIGGIQTIFRQSGKEAHYRFIFKVVLKANNIFVCNFMWRGYTHTIIPVLL